MHNEVLSIHIKKRAMNRLLILLIGVIIISCNPNEKKTNEAEINTTQERVISHNFDWLLGNWKRTNDEEGMETFENWVKINDAEYLGLGFTMENEDTVSQEVMRFFKTDGHWHLGINVGDNSEAVIFNSLSHTETEFVFENSDIDFPKKIKYWKNGPRINASISNDEMEILYEFEKINN
jgi:hypothetical protein